MRLANPFIKARREVIQAYFEKLAEVDDLEDSWEIDKFQEHISNKPVNLMLSQIFLCHSLLWSHLDEICPDAVSAHSELRKLLQALGPPKSFAEDKVAVLQMVNARKDRESYSPAESDLFAEPAQHAQYIKAREMLLTVMSALPDAAVAAAQGAEFMHFLEAQQVAASGRKAPELASQIADLVRILKSLAGMGLLAQGDKELSFNEFLSNFAKEVQSGNERLRHLTKRLDLIQGADQSITAHYLYLESRLELYRVYLDNVRAGGTVMTTTKKKAKDDKKRTHKFSLQQLVDENVVVKVGQEIPKKVYKKVYFRFTEISPSVFKVDVTIKEGIELNVLDKPLEIGLDELLRKQDAHEDTLDFDVVGLNVNILVRFLNQHFVAA